MKHIIETLLRTGAQIIVVSALKLLLFNNKGQKGLSLTKDNKFKIIGKVWEYYSNSVNKSDKSTLGSLRQARRDILSDIRRLNVSAYTVPDFISKPVTEALSLPVKGKKGAMADVVNASSAVVSPSETKAQRVEMLEKSFVSNYPTLKTFKSIIFNLDNKVESLKFIQKVLILNVKIIFWPLLLITLFLYLRKFLTWVGITLGSVYGILRYNGIKPDTNEYTILMLEVRDWFINYWTRFVNWAFNVQLADKLQLEREIREKISDEVWKQAYDEALKKIEAKYFDEALSKFNNLPEKPVEEAVDSLRQKYMQDKLGITPSDEGGLYIDSWVNKLSDYINSWLPSSATVVNTTIVSVATLSAFAALGIYLQKGGSLGGHEDEVRKVYKAVLGYCAARVWGEVDWEDQNSFKFKFKERDKDDVDAEKDALDAETKGKGRESGPSSGESGANARQTDAEKSAGNSNNPNNSNNTGTNTRVEAYERHNVLDVLDAKKNSGSDTDSDCSSNGSAPDTESISSGSPNSNSSADGNVGLNTEPKIENRDDSINTLGSQGSATDTNSPYSSDSEDSSSTAGPSTPTQAKNASQGAGTTGFAITGDHHVARYQQATNNLEALKEEFTRDTDGSARQGSLSLDQLSQDQQNQLQRLEAIQKQYKAVLVEKGFFNPETEIRPQAEDDNKISDGVQASDAQVPHEAESSAPVNPFAITHIPTEKEVAFLKAFREIEEDFDEDVKEYVKLYGTELPKLRTMEDIDRYGLNQIGEADKLKLQYLIKEKLQKQGEDKFILRQSLCGARGSETLSHILKLTEDENHQEMLSEWKPKVKVLDKYNEAISVLHSYFNKIGFPMPNLDEDKEDFALRIKAEQDILDDNGLHPKALPTYKGGGPADPDKVAKVTDLFFDSKQEAIDKKAIYTCCFRNPRFGEVNCTCKNSS